MSVKMRQEVERKIVGQFVRDALAAGHRLAVSLDRGYDLDEMLLGSRDETAIMEAAFAGDECHIFVQEGMGPTTEADYATTRERIGGANNVIERVVSIGYVYCVFGNDGWDVIADYTTNLEALLTEANKIADTYAD